MYILISLFAAQVSQDNLKLLWFHFCSDCISGVLHLSLWGGHTCSSSLSCCVHSPVKYCRCCFFPISFEPQQASTSEPEEGIIPDSPILMSSLPVPNKLKKRKDVDKGKHVRYAEMPLPCKSLFSGQSVLKNGSDFLNRVRDSAKSPNVFGSVSIAPDTQPVDATKSPGRPQVLVPDTCVLDSSQVLSINSSPVFFKIFSLFHQ